MVVLPTEEDIETGVYTDEPFVVWFGQHDADVFYNGYTDYTNPRSITNYVTEVHFDIDEHYYQGCLYDEDFRLIQMGEWSDHIYAIPHWQGSMFRYDFLTNTMPYSEAMAIHIIPKATATIDALWNNEWEELTEELTGNNDIVVSQIPAQ